MPEVAPPLSARLPERIVRKLYAFCVSRYRDTGKLTTYNAGVVELVSRLPTEYDESYFAEVSWSRPTQGITIRLPVALFDRLHGFCLVASKRMHRVVRPSLGIAMIVDRLPDPDETALQGPLPVFPRRAPNHRART